MTGTGAFGPFALIVESGDGPALLEPESDAARSTLAWLRRIMARREYRSVHFRELLGVEDWRANLVGLAAVALHPRGARFVPDLWQAVERGSAASPQLVYLLRRLDAEFAENGKARLARLCATPPSPPAGELEPTSPDRSGPARCVAAILTMLATLPGEAAWTEAHQRLPEVRALLECLPLGDPSVTQWGARFDDLLGHPPGADGAAPVP